MNLLVVGPGAMGCLFAARLKIAGNRVMLLDYDKERAKRISEQGVKVEGVSGIYDVHIPILAGDHSFRPDYILICVKSNNTKEAGESAISFAGPGTKIVTLQNGIGNVEILAQIFGNDKVFGGVTAQAATLLEEGSIRHAGEGETIIGPKGQGESSMQALASCLNSAGFETRLVDNVEELIWGKLIINVGINALTAITRLKNGRIPIVAGTRKVMEGAVKEAVSIAETKGIRLPYEKPLDRVVAVCEATKDNISSMLQDVLKGKLTEVAMMNGAIAREGERLRIPTPVNRTLAHLVQAIHEGGSNKMHAGPIKEES